ncbi:MAG: sulfite exporter TauE/SafE family protein [Actinobacteria bacterium]|nr:MAG: sulfite exporter TauE/SafE family protein [Actinomycetota bacterium]
MLIQALLGILSGLVSGVMSGAFGVGGAILTTPAVQVLLGAPPIVAVGTPLPAILPSTLSGMQAYRRTGQIDHRAVRWAAPPGVAGAAVGALLTKWVEPRILLLITALLIAWQAKRVASGPAVDAGSGATVAPSGTAFALMGLIAGFASGLLGIGGGVIMVPVMVTILGMPLKRAIGTSLVAISFMVIPGTIVHTALGHIDWWIFLWLTLGVVPGAAIGSRWTVRAQERVLRRVVAVFLFLVAVAYAALEIHDLLLR